MSAVLLDWNDLVGKHEWPTLLLGNGFSINIWSGFNYNNIFDQAELSPCDREYVESLNVTNFEQVIDHLSFEIDRTATFGGDAAGLSAARDRIRNSFFTAVRKVHPEPKAFTYDRRMHVANALNDFENVFTLNYDLLAYWALSASKSVNIPDGFPGPEYLWIGNAAADKRIRFLHGALHLWHDPVECMDGKLVRGDGKEKTNLLELLPELYESASARKPLLVSEGTAGEKSMAIADSEYLKSAHSELECDRGNTVVLGAAFADVDSHVTDALDSGPRRQIAVSVHLNDRNEATVDAEMCEIRERLGSQEVLFFDSKTHPLTCPSLNCDPPK